MSQQKTSINRNSITRRKIKARLAEAQNWRCCYCGIRMEGFGDDLNAPTFEHVIPLRDGGSNRHSENIVIACRTCNGTRANKEMGHV